MFYNTWIGNNKIVRKKRIVVYARGIDIDTQLHNGIKYSLRKKCTNKMCKTALNYFCPRKCPIETTWIVNIHTLLYETCKSQKCSIFILYGEQLPNYLKTVYWNTLVIRNIFKEPIKILIPFFSFCDKNMAMVENLGTLVKWCRML